MYGHCVKNHPRAGHSATLEEAKAAFKAAIGPDAGGKFERLDFTLSPQGYQSRACHYYISAPATITIATI